MSNLFIPDTLFFERWEGAGDFLRKGQIPIFCNSIIWIYWNGISHDRPNLLYPCMPRSTWYNHRSINIFDQEYIIHVCCIQMTDSSVHWQLIYQEDPNQIMQFNLENLRSWQFFHQQRWIINENAHNIVNTDKKRMDFKKKNAINIIPLILWT